MKEIFIDVIYLSIINSFIVYGVKNVIKTIINKDELSRFIGLGLTFAAGLIQGLFFDAHILLSQKIMYGFFIGCISVGIYESAVKSLLQLIPGVIDKLFGSK